MYKQRKEENTYYEEDISNGISNGYDNCKFDCMQQQTGRDNCSSYRGSKD